MRQGGKHKMKLFSKKEDIMVNSEAQKDEMIAKLEKANVEYKLLDNNDSVFKNGVSYIIRVEAAELKKVV